MKAIKLALIFFGFVALLVLAISWRQIFRSSAHKTPAGETVVFTKDDNPQDEPQELYSPASETTPVMEVVEKETKISGETKVSDDMDLKARHIAEKKELENEAMSLFNSGKYKECETLCRKEWCLNAYYVDVKTMGKILSSSDKSLHEALNRDGITDSGGRLTERYYVKSVADFASLKSLLEQY